MFLLSVSRFPMVSYWSSNLTLKRIWSILWTDHRVRAALLAFLLPNCSIPLIEPHLRIFSLSLLHHLVLTIVCLCALPMSRNRWKFNTQSFLLGVVNGWSIAFALIYGGSGLHILTFCVYAYFLTLFHFSEFFMTALTNLESLRPDSFLLNHSPAYWTAAMCSWIEFWARAWVFPSLCSLYISSFGILCCIVGELFRKLAMCHASVGFTHQADRGSETQRPPTLHKRCLLSRQTSRSALSEWLSNRHFLHFVRSKRTVQFSCYLGWMVWSVGTQLILCNPVCAQAYAFFAYRFFEDRIWEEERYLIEFFGQRYIAYQRRVPSGIPYIKGYAAQG